MKETINYRKYREISIILIIVFIILIMLPKLLNGWFAPELVNYRIKPIIWSGFFIVIIRYLPRVHHRGKLSKQENIYLESIICAAVLTGIQFLAGSMIGQLGESPYILTPNGIFNNMIFIAPVLIVREFIRAYVLGSYCVKPNPKAFVTITIIMTLSDINFSNLFLARSLEELAIYIAKEFGPLLCQNIMLSYLALYGGAGASLSYLGVITIFHWTSPILPVLNWLAEGAIGILVPIFALMFFIKKYEVHANNARREPARKGEGVLWTLTALLSIGLIWFVVGVFPIMPSVVATGSMQPLIYPGDVILLEQIRSEEQVRNLEVGDIIQFQREEILITHRIIEIEEDKLKNLTFHTKGDNNSAPDSQVVKANDIRGIYSHVIPKIGYPTLIIKGHSQTGFEDIEF
ncbi:MAG: signal peptidase I [Eubacteriales bacterium]|nr:signal peptidase I [Eubacteriales bacterium]MDD4630263.1 signal peptidase I [Eubacteriales bacterium]